VASQPDATADTSALSADASQPSAYKDTRASKESPSEIVITQKKSASAPPASETIVVNCETIRGPGFVVSLRAVEMEAALRSLPKEFARAKAEAMARQWAASGSVPKSPDATIARALREEANDRAVHGTRLNRAAKSHGPADELGLSEADRKALGPEGVAKYLELKRAREAGHA